MLNYMCHQRFFPRPVKVHVYCTSILYDTGTVPEQYTVLTERTEQLDGFAFNGPLSFSHCHYQTGFGNL